MTPPEATTENKGMMEEAIKYTEQLIRESKHAFPNCWSMIREAYIAGAKSARLKAIYDCAKKCCSIDSSSISHETAESNAEAILALAKSETTKETKEQTEKLEYILIHLDWAEHLFSDKNNLDEALDALGRAQNALKRWKNTLRNE